MATVLEKNKLLVLLLLTDLVFILLHVVYQYTELLPSSLYSLARDRGYAEFFQYTKELWAAVLLIALAVKQRQALYFIFSGILIYFLFDDALEFHEQFGELLADWLNLQPAFGLRVVDWGELLVSGFFGLLFLISISIGFYLSGTRARSIAAALVGLIFVMAFFGVLLDMVEIIVPRQEAADLLRIVEDGGEMVVMSVIVWFIYRLDLYNPQPPDWQPFLRRVKRVFPSSR